MSTVDSDTEEALFERCAALVLNPALPVAYPNVAFSSPNGPQGAQPYLAVNLMAASARAFSVDTGAEASDVRKGVLQVSVFWPVGQGTTLAKQIASQIVSWFARGTDLWYGSTRVRLGASYASSAVEEDDYYMLPVTVPWSVFT